MTAEGPSEFSEAMITHACGILLNADTDFTDFDYKIYSDVCMNSVEACLKQHWGDNVTMPATDDEWRELGSVAQGIIAA